MIPFLDSIFSTDRYAARAEKDQARLIYGFTVVLMVMFTLYALFVVQRNPQATLVQQASRDIRALLPIVSTLVIGTITLVLTRVGRIDISAAGPVVIWYLSGVVLGVQRQFMLSDDGAALMLLLILSAIFLRVRGLVIGTVVALVTLAFPAFNYQFGGIGIGAYRTAVAGLVFQILVTAALTYLFLRSTRLDQIEGTARASEERFKLANVTTQIAQRISRRTALADLLNSAVEDIRDSYANLYHVQIFLIDETTRQAVLAASTGEVGRVLLERRHSLPVGSQSVIGAVTQTGEPVIARADTPESVHRRNEFLPDTRVEAAFPLRIGSAVIGALDLQSREPGEFAPNDIPIFQSLADNIAIAIDNARLFEQTGQRLQENHRLLEQMRGAMREVERLNRDLTQQVWSEYLQGKSERLGVEVDFSRGGAVHAADWTPTLNQAVWSDTLIQKPTREGITVSIPLRVRGLVIGAMEFELDGSETLAPEEVDLVEAVAERFGLAVESTRLYEESRRVAQRESTLNEIGSRLQRTNSIDSVLAEAARGLQSSLGASRVAIRLGAPPKTNGGAT
ncbi:MAG: GAF domain-containing protein [Anaerolineae bacterium]|nr:GAF domain-containing protein [Anaerolineae bacterium]